MNDENLKPTVERILRGDFKAFKDFVDNHKKLVSFIVFRMVPNSVDREDICQDVFVKVFQNLQNFQFQCKISTWLAKIAYNTCYNYLEKKRIPLFDDETPVSKSFDAIPSAIYSPIDYIEKQEQNVLLHREIDKLKPVYRTIITLYHLNELSYNEIGDIMKLPEGTVKSYLFRARKILKEQLSAKYREEELC